MARLQELSFQPMRITQPDANLRDARGGIGIWIDREENSV